MFNGVKKKKLICYMQVTNLSSGRAKPRTLDRNCRYTKHVGDVSYIPCI